MKSYSKTAEDGLLLRNKMDMENNQATELNYTPLKIGRPKRPIRLLVLLIIAFFIGNIIGLIIFVTKVNQSASKITSPVKASVNKDARPDFTQILGTSSSDSKLDPQEPDIYGTKMRFTSYKLGISFNYLTHWWKKKDSIEDSPTDVFISRNINKVCISYNLLNSGGNCTGGQYVLMLKKKAETSLKMTIEEELLKNSQNNCTVKTHISGEKEIAEVIPLSDNCPETYSKRSVDKYFLYDNKFPDRFAFISLGQHPILADTDYNTWEKTLTFFNPK